MRKHIKTIISIVLCVVALVWIIPTVFVKTTVSEIKEYELIQSVGAADKYKITFSYQRDGETKTGSYTAKYGHNYAPLIGEQGACYYLTIPPYFVFTGKPGSPISPLLLLVASAIVYLFKFPKFLKKKEKSDENQA